MHFLSLLQQTLIWLLKLEIQVFVSRAPLLPCWSQRAALMPIHWSWNSFNRETGSALKEQLGQALDCILAHTGPLLSVAPRQKHKGTRGRNKKGLDWP